MIPRTYEEKPIQDISKVIDLSLDYNPMLATADMSTIRMWCNGGCDIELDIIPTLKEIMKKRTEKKISSFSYFTNPILASRDKRLATQKLNHAPIPDSLRYERIKWLMDKGLHVSAEHEIWFKEYEKTKDCKPDEIVV